MKNMNWEDIYLQFKTHAPLDSLEANRLRQLSFERFLSRGLPTRKNEAWKYTSLEKFKNQSWSVPLGESQEIGLSHDQLKFISSYLTADFDNYVFVNGQLNATLSDETTGKIKVIEVQPDDFNSPASVTEEGVAYLAEAFLHQKIQIELNRQQVFNKPIHILFVHSVASLQYISQKLQVILAENAQLSLIVQTVTLPTSRLEENQQASNLALDFRLDPSAQLRFVQLQNENMNQISMSQVHAILQKNSIFQSTCVSLGSELNRNYLHAELRGVQASAQLFGVSILNEAQHTDHYTCIQHVVGENQSEQNYKAILAGSAQSVFRGRVRIEPDAQKSNSSQLNNNLLLSRQAQANSVPQLEIFADDVKAGHGSTVGQLNQDEIFYFLSRGINANMATQMLAMGFVQELLYKIEQPMLQAYVLSAVKSKLERMMKNV